MYTALTIRNRTTALLEFVAIVSVGYFLKLGLDQVIWRYSGPTSLVIMLAGIAVYFRMKGRSASDLGLIRLPRRKSYLLIFPQILLAIAAILLTGAIVVKGGEALGLEFMKEDATGANERFGDIAGNRNLYLMWLGIVWIASPAEELYFRSFMINQLSRVTGRSIIGVMISVLIPAIIFGFGHVYYQGLRGFVLTGAIGLTLGILFLLFKRNVWPLMVAHAAVNTLAFTAVYLGLES